VPELDNQNKNRLFFGAERRKPTNIIERIGKDIKITLSLMLPSNKIILDFGYTNNKVKANHKNNGRGLKQPDDFLFFGIISSIISHPPYLVCI